MRLISEYKLLESVIGDNAGHVWRRAFKHDPDAPSLTTKQHEALQIAIRDELMNAISEWFTFEEQDTYTKGVQLSEKMDRG